MHKRLRNVLAVAVCTLPAISNAEVDIRGFASVGGGIFSEDDFAFEGVDDEFTSDPFTRFALQTKAKINDKTDFTGQLIARGVDDYEIEAEWAYITYHLNFSTDIRVGRIRSPFFLYSDFIDVGYAYPWIRPPQEVYRIPFSTVEGFDLVNKHSLGDWDGTVQAYFGRLSTDSEIGGEELAFNLENMAGINYTVGNDWLNLRFSYNRADISIAPSTGAQGLLAQLTQAGFPDVAEALLINDEDGQFYGVGYNIDYENWISAGEFTVLDVGDQSLLTDDDAWYVMVGRRIGEVTLHLTYSEQSSDPDFTFLNTIASSTNPAIQPLAAFSRGAVAVTEDTNVILGLRYDYAASSAFKFEVTRVEQELTDQEGTLVAFSFDVVF